MSVQPSSKPKSFVCPKCGSRIPLDQLISSGPKCSPTCPVCDAKLEIH